MLLHKISLAKRSAQEFGREESDPFQAKEDWHEIVGHHQDPYGVSRITFLRQVMGIRFDYSERSLLASCLINYLCDAHSLVSDVNMLTHRKIAMERLAQPGLTCRE